MQATHVEEPTRQVPVLAKADVVVVGGGTAGVVAALAAAKNGAKTVLVERHGHLGGALINGATSLHSFFNAYGTFPEAGKHQLVKGLPQEIVGRMVAEGGCAGHIEMEIGAQYDPCATSFDPEIFKKVAFDLMREYGVRVFVHTVFSDVLTNEQGIYGIVVECKSGRQAILGKEFVDCSGDGDVAARAGAEFTEMTGENRPYGVAMTFGMGNVDAERALQFGLQNKLVENLARGDKGSATESIVRFSLSLRKYEATKPFMDAEQMWGPIIVTTKEHQMNYINCTRYQPTNALDVEDITNAEMSLRDQIDGMVKQLQQHVPGFENSYLNWTSVAIGVRRTRTITCEYDVSLDDVLQGRQFDDRIGQFSFTDYPNELRWRVAGGKSYAVPFRALIPKRLERVLVAGRMTTTDRVAHNSTRNTVCCMMEGEAAGTAAALAAKQGIPSRKLDVALLQETLRRNGAVVDSPFK